MRDLEVLLREDTAGEFQIERMIGRGGMAVVFLATETHLARKVAIKVLPPELTYGHGIERFKREAKTAAALDHPHIIPIHRIASGGKLFWYAMKYVEGRSLDDLLAARGKVALSETVEILGPVAEALDHAHQNQVIHRDVKPANVMLEEGGRVVVTDFGIAKPLTEGTLTASGSIVGTPYYMSPEQAMGRTVTGASDQYSTGVMAYRMLAARVPFDGDSAIEILQKHVSEPPPPLDVVLTNLPGHVAWAVHKALEKKPEDRFPTVRAFVDGLAGRTPEASVAAATTVAEPRGVTASEAPTAVAPPAAAPTTPVPQAVTSRRAVGRRRRFVPLVLTVVLAGIVGAALGLWWLGRGQPAQPEAAGQPPESEAAGPATPVGIADTGAAAPATGPVEGEVGETEVAVGDTGRTPDTVEETATPRPPQAGRVEIVGLPERGSVTLDGERRSGTSFELAEGRHTVRMAAPGFTTVTDTVSVVGGERTAVSYGGRRLNRPDGRLLRPATLGYRLTLESGGRSSTHDVLVTLDAATVGGRTVWRVRHATTLAGTPLDVDSIELEYGDLRPIRAISILRRTRTTLRWSANTVTGQVDRPGREPSQVQVRFESQPPGPWYRVNEPIAALPLAEGYEARFQMLVAGPWRTRVMRIAVTGTETVRCEAGTFEAFVVEITPLDGNPAGARTLKVRRAAPHYLLLEEREGRLTSRLELSSIEQ
jgi:predicted Ser/Thr protein kinase